MEKSLLFISFHIKKHQNTYVHHEKCKKIQENISFKVGKLFEGLEFVNVRFDAYDDVLASMLLINTLKYIMYSEAKRNLF